ncbi:hypothetical protein OHB00_44405 [Streptomyces sp. NBC_00631]|uniref:hypothetical protein n=1 Tax=Streptomyces sp. NBC_00631 TaxID=2975793 RepID=UPI0030E58E7F
MTAGAAAGCLLGIALGGTASALCRFAEAREIAEETRDQVLDSDLNTDIASVSQA